MLDTFSIFDAKYAFFDWLLFASCKGAVITTIVLAATHVLGKYFHAQAKAMLWLIAAAAFAMPVGWQADVSTFWPEDNAYAEDIGYSTLRSSTETFIEAQPGTASITLSRETSNGLVAMRSRLQLSDVLAAIWLLGALALAAIFSMNTVRFWRIKRAGQPINPDLTLLFDACRTEVGVSKDVEVVSTSAVKSPILLGVWKSTLLLPDNFTRLFSREQSRHVFLHELAHIQRNDLFTLWSVALIQIAHWFNPFVWLLGHKLRGELESACDARVLHILKSQERLEYGHTLIRAAELPALRTFSAQAGMAESHAQLKARIQMIRHFNTRRKHSIVAWLALLLIAPLTLAQRQDNSATPAISSQTNASKPVNAIQTEPNKREPLTVSPSPATAAPSRPLGTGSTGMRVMYFKINYVDAADLQTLIQSGSGVALLSARGSVAIDARTNTLLVNDTEERLAAVRELVTNIDVPLRRISIDARLALVDRQISRELIARNQPAGISASAAQRAATATTDASYNVDMELDAIQSARQGEVIASPRIVTGNRKEATLKQGIAFPITSNKNDPAQLEKSILTITSRPVIAPDGSVQLYVTIRRENAEKTSTAVNEAPAADTFQIGAESLIRAGQTFVAALPPYAHGTHKEELLVFLTPKIVLEEATRNF